jgi:glycerol-3-phosphate dehydrogenase
VVGVQLDIDIAIIGGGIAGLWTLNHLRNSGYNAVLFEREALGSYQTIASQGMIHGGIKYALAGAWSGGSEAISAMPATWRAALAGEGTVDLRNCRVLSEDFYLFSSGNLQSRMTSFFASKMLRGRVEQLAREQYPAALNHTQYRGQVYRLVDLVLDVPSLVSALAEQHSAAIFNIDWSQAALQRAGDSAVIALPNVTVNPKALVLTAGTGNESLIRQLQGSEPAMQRRPLQQVLVKHQYTEHFYGHCIGSGSSPRLTISSHRTAQGEPVWYLGGDLATENTDAEPEQLIATAQRELADILPWIDFGACQWQTVKLDRAEPRQSSLLRPDSAFVGAVDSVNNTLAAWPTKLSLTPDLAREIEDSLRRRGLEPGPQPNLAPLAALGTPAVATPCWDSEFA